MIASEPAPLLVVHDIVAGYEPDLPIVNGVTFAVAPGELLAVLGPNGAGKSTAIKAVAGLVPLTEGRIVLDGPPVHRVPAHRRLALGLAYVPQTDNVFGTLSVGDNLRLAGDRLASRHEASRQTDAMYAAFPDLARQRSLPAARLSGGQRQMLAVARALMASPRVLLLDEPSAGLSPRLVEDVFGRLAAIRDGGVAIVLVEQNVRAALRIADRALVLVEGRNRHQGPAASLAADAALAALYLGGRAPAGSRP